MELGSEFRSRIEGWDGLSRWERSELGKDLRRARAVVRRDHGPDPGQEVHAGHLVSRCQVDRGAVGGDQVATSADPPGIPRDTQRKRASRDRLDRGSSTDSKPFTFRMTPSGHGRFLYWAEGRRLETTRTGALRTRSPASFHSLDPDVLTVRRCHLLAATLHLHEGNDEGERGISGRAETRNRSLPTSTRLSSSPMGPGTGRTIFRRCLPRHDAAEHRCLHATMVWIEVEQIVRAFPITGTRLPSGR